MGRMEDLGLLQVLERQVALWEETGHRPDRWEAFCVMAGLAHIERHNESAARRSIVFAQLQPELRPPSYFDAIPESFGLLELWHIRLALNDLAGIAPKKARRKLQRRASEAP